jgi:branched-chain amino acid transport system ATP-binding protein
LKALEVRSLTRRFSGLVAVDDLSFAYDGGRPLGIIGPNGSGKTTVFNIITSFLRPNKGSVRSFGHELTNLAPEEVARRGVRRTFQQSMVFNELTVEGNLRVAVEDILPAHQQHSFWANEADRLGFLLTLCGLDAFRHHRVEEIPFGITRLLGLAMALAGPVRLLLLDEPGAGLTAGETSELTRVINYLVGREVPIIIVDHNTNFVFSVCDEVVVMDRGRVITRGRPDVVAADPAVISVYLGTRVAAG